MIGLLRLLRHRSDALEADLLERGIDLLDYWRGNLSLRRLLVLYRWLPEASAVRRWERGTEWTVAHDIADWHRREAAAAAGVDNPGPHPASPEAKAAAEAETRRAETRRDRLAQAKATKADRDRRIAAGELT